MFSSIQKKLTKFILDTVAASNITGNPNVLSIDPSATVRGTFLKGRIEVMKKAQIRKSHLDGQINIGQYTQVNGPGVFIMGAIHGVSIGNFCSIARNVTIQEHNHNYSRVSSYFFQKHFFTGKEEDDIVSNGPIIIGNDVWIGANATILSGVTIGDGAVIAANALVTKDVSPYAIVGGVPASLLRYRFSQPVIDILLQTKWWNWDEQRIKLNRHIFSADTIDEELLKSIK
jgi:virginiamycin A acetyltransferase